MRTACLAAAILCAVCVQRTVGANHTAFGASNANWLIVYGTFDGGNHPLNAELVGIPGVTTAFCESYGYEIFTVPGSMSCLNVVSTDLTLKLATSILTSKDPANPAPDIITVDELRPPAKPGAQPHTCKEDCASIVKGLVAAGAVICLSHSFPLPSVFNLCVG